jgi:hypothetical protein
LPKLGERVRAAPDFDQFLDAGRSKEWKRRNAAKRANRVTPRGHGGRYAAAVVWAP